MKNTALKKLNRIRKYPVVSNKIVSSSEINRVISKLGHKPKARAAFIKDLERVILDCLTSLDEVKAFKRTTTKTKFQDDLKSLKNSLKKISLEFSTENIRRPINAHFDLNQKKVPPKDIDYLVKSLSGSNAYSVADLYLELSHIILRAVNSGIEETTSYNTFGKFTESLLYLFSNNPKIKMVEVYCFVMALLTIEPFNDSKNRNYSLLLEFIHAIIQSDEDHFICPKSMLSPSTVQEIKKITNVIHKYSAPEN